MEMYHPDIYEKLNNFITTKQIPNIIFHGEHGSGKKTIMQKFLKDIYAHTENYQQYIMYVNCAEGKGIKFIREELKFFAKTNIHNYNGTIIKSIVLLNADYLTIDAQSALRRCIELFSNYTRFFIVIENQFQLIKPILSRFCSIHIYKPKVKDRIVNLHTLSTLKYPATFYRKKQTALKKIFESCETSSMSAIHDMVNKLYEKGCCGLDVISYIENSLEDSKEKFDLLVYVKHLKNEIRNEELFMFLILNCYKMRNTPYLENINIL